MIIHNNPILLIGINQKFSSMIDRYKHQQLRIGLVSPQQISTWAAKILPNGEIVGEVTKPYTFHYKTNKPEKDGLFCERIFGPIKSGICACGNYRVIGDEKEDPKFCQRFPRAGRRLALECKGRRELDCKTHPSSRDESLRID
ncbi:DNA-directed RNA polymerase subunit beta' [Castilleja foliolosa]|uniref:DNA-directed RNA polymerase n=1 Tax=Castilleja foliolosa TaxID=1961234 RepID=A0ABD3E5D7_9LAMI